MKYIKIPEPITLTHKNLAPQQPTSFYKWLEENMLGGAPFQKGYEGLKSAFDLMQSMKNAEVGTWVPVEKTTWDRLIEALNTVEWTHPVIALQYLPFMDAIKEAKNHNMESA